LFHKDLEQAVMDFSFVKIVHEVNILGTFTAFVKKNLLEIEVGVLGDQVFP